MAPRIELFPFRFRDPVTGKWVRARYRAERQEIASRYAEWEIVGPAEIRESRSREHYFTPHQREAPLSNLGAILAIASGAPRRVPIVGVAW